MNNKANISLLLKRDLWAGVLIVIIGLLLFNTAISSTDRNMLFPSIVFAVMIVTGVFIAASAIKNQNAANIKAVKVYWLEVAIFVMLIISIDIIRIFGFYFALGIVTLFLTFLFFKNFSLKGIIKTVVYSVVLTGSVYFIFSFLLRILTPKGLFF